MDTIAAVATARGIAAGIGVLRISGENAVAAAEHVLRLPGGGTLHAVPSRKLMRCALLDSTGAVIDDILAVVFRAPNSYTGEDVVELQCHGAPVVLEEALKALQRAGARQAKPGEFTKRAFLNGRMDLTQAEAVVDLIDAETAEEARNAVGQLGGAIARPVGEVYDALMDITSRFYAVVDYPDEDIEPLQQQEMEQTLRRSEETLRRLLSTAERGRILKKGVPTAIVGRPNAGKSSLLNALAGYDRAIVTDIPGTTRDTVEEKVLCGGILLRLIDTAGIRDTEDAVEKIGVERSRQAMDSAELVLAVVDGTVKPTEEDAAILKQAARHEKWILVWSKADLSGTAAVPYLSFADDFHAPAAIVEVSSVTGQGLDQLEKAVAALYPKLDVPQGAVVTNARQTEAIARALDAVTAAREALESGMTPDVVLTDGEEALNALGELTGKTVRDDLVATIFSRFCVGK